MPAQNQNQFQSRELDWQTVRDSAGSQVRASLNPVTATPRRHGALRYRCPVTGSYVLVTDANTLHWLARPRAKLRCADCGELHLMSVDEYDQTFSRL